HPEIAELLATSDHEYLEELEKRLQKKITIKPRDRFHLEHYEIRGLSGEQKHSSKGSQGDDSGILERRGLIRGLAAAAAGSPLEESEPIAPSGRHGYRQD